MSIRAQNNHINLHYPLVEYEAISSQKRQPIRSHTKESRSITRTLITECGRLHPHPSDIRASRAATVSMFVF